MKPVLGLKPMVRVALGVDSGPAYSEAWGSEALPGKDKSRRYKRCAPLIFTKEAQLHIDGRSGELLTAAVGKDVSLLQNGILIENVCGLNDAPFSRVILQ
jgi:hypothetical protein